jgi:hypothetical protein
VLREILWRIFGPVQDSSGWRIRYNQELDRLIEGQDLVRFIKAQRLRWLGHVERMSETQMPKRILKGRLNNRRRKGRPRMRWMDSVIVDLATMGIRGWRIKVADRDAWRTVVNEAKTHQGLYSRLKKKKMWGHENITANARSYLSTFYMMH